MLWGRVCFCHGRVFTDARARSAHELAEPLSKEHRQKIAKALMGNKHALGQHHTEETKKRISETLKERMSLRAAIVYEEISDSPSMRLG